MATTAKPLAVTFELPNAAEALELKEFLDALMARAGESIFLSGSFATEKRIRGNVGLLDAALQLALLRSGYRSDSNGLSN